MIQIPFENQFSSSKIENKPPFTFDHRFFRKLETNILGPAVQRRIVQMERIYPQDYIKVYHVKLY